MLTNFFYFKACAIDLYSKSENISTREKVSSFINCTVTSKNWKSNPYDTGGKCTHILNSEYPWKDLDECAKSTHEDKLGIMYSKTLELGQILEPGMNFSMNLIFLILKLQSLLKSFSYLCV